MTGVMSLFTQLRRKHKGSSKNLMIQIINNSGMRILVANEEVYSRYSESFYLPAGKQYHDTMKKGSLLYFWKQDKMIGDITVPETAARDLTIQVGMNDAVQVS